MADPRAAPGDGAHVARPRLPAARGQFVVGGRHGGDFPRGVVQTPPILARHGGVFSNNSDRGDPAAREGVVWDTRDETKQRSPSATISLVRHPLARMAAWDDSSRHRDEPPCGGTINCRGDVPSGSSRRRAIISSSSGYMASQKVTKIRSNRRIDMSRVRPDPGGASATAARSATSSASGSASARSRSGSTTSPRPRPPSRTLAPPSRFAAVGGSSPLARSRRRSTVAVSRLCPSSPSAFSVGRRRRSSLSVVAVGLIASAVAVGAVAARGCPLVTRARATLRGALARRRHRRRRAVRSFVRSFARPFFSRAATSRASRAYRRRSSASRREI